jgi:acyl-CoA dehydrogenase
LSPFPSLRRRDCLKYLLSDARLGTAYDAVGKVIEFDDLAPEAISPIYKKPADVHQFFQGLGEQKAAS